ncbi:polysaccharide biosynthesis/export family protein [Sphingomonas humi]|uniref:Soluble ligand binding domain-containing protein n=1 Tax=Sphingomonas humi TaxID=335630 RepID=A0ABP7S876_9SPHN
MLARLIRYQPTRGLEGEGLNMGLMAKSVAGAALFTTLGLSGCADKPGGPIPYNVQLAAPDAPKPVSIEQNYRIAPLDTVTVSIFRQKDLSGDYEVDLTGRINMPLIGSLEAAELTTTELDQKITAAYGAKYLVNPDVGVGVKTSTRRSVTVDGSVKQSGSFPVGAPITLLQAIALSGGVAEDANLRRVAVFRTVDGQRKAAAFDLQAIRRGQAPDPQIFAGDIVVVDGSGIKDAQKRILSNIPLLSIFRPF